jgi:outer membrane cobalamin receptor
VGIYRSVFASSFCLFCFISSFAEAQDMFVEADELLLFQDMDLVVTASRLEQPKDQLSVPLTVLTSNDLHYGGHTSISEALRFAPGVDVLRMDRSRYWVGIHGLQGMFSDRMMTLVDGMPADSPAFGGPEFSSLPVTIEDIERIEIVRGSGGAAWGANALSGVVNIITKDPSSTPGMFVSSNVSAFGDSSSQVRYAEKSGDWSWLISAAYEDLRSSADALDLNEERVVDDFMRRTLARTAVIYETETDLKVSFGAGITGTERGAFETSSIQTYEENDLDTANAYLRAEKKFSSSIEGYFRWAGRYQDMDRPSYGNAQYKVRENDFEGQVTLSGFDKHSIALGGNFRCTHFSSRPYVYEVFTLADDDIYERWVGVFGLDRYQYSRQLALESQFRMDYFSEGDVDWSGRLSSIYGIDSDMNHVLRVSAAKSYRQPVGFIRNAIYDSSPGTQPFAQHYSVDPGMEPEQAWSLETGYSWNIRQYLKLKTDLYYMWYKDLIGGRGEWGISSSGTPEVIVDITNTGDADGFGGEIQLEYQAGDLLWTVWYGYSNFETEYSHQSIRAFLPATDKIGVKCRWTIAENWTLNGQYVYANGVKEDISEVSLSSSNHMDLTIAKSFLDRKGEIMMGVKDLLNKDHDPLVGIDQTAGNKIPGRTFFARLQYTF